MMFNKKISAFGLTSAILFSAATAFAEGESVEAQQTSLLQKLDSLNAAVLGLKLNGNIKAAWTTQDVVKSHSEAATRPTPDERTKA